MITNALINFRAASLLAGVWLLTAASPATIQTFMRSANAADGLQQLKYNNLGLVVDRVTQQVTVMASSEGGMDI